MSNISEAAAFHGDINTQIGEFTDAQWYSLVGRIAAVFGMDESGLERLRSNSVLKLVGALPFLAGCDEPERTALAHMSTFVIAGHPATKSAFSHNFKDSASLEKRLEPISHFSSGDGRIIDWGMKLLMIAMINDHIRDAEEDRAVGKMNPVNAGHWDGQNLIETLRFDMPQFTEDRLTQLRAEVETQTFWVR